MKVDNAVLKRYTRKEIAYMPKPLLDLINYGNKQPSNQMNTDFLIIFYQDKELFGITSALKLEKEIRGKIQVTLEDLAKIIEKLDNLKLAEQISGKVSQVESEKEYRKDAAYSHLKDNQYFLKSQLNDTQDYLKQDLKVQEKDKIPVKEPSDLIDSIGFLRVDNKEISDLKDSEFKLEEAEDDLGIENFEQIFEENLKRKDIDVKLEDRQISENLLSRMISKSDVSSDRSRIEINITENEGKMLIKKIFNKDEEKFKKALLDLCKCSSWKEAAAYIDKIFVENDINPYSNPAIEFTNKVQIAFLSGTNNVY
jgi:Asp-tRNA(Asn)/Glu-tRNA(Gln) amidotransferase C subunit